ncbi:MAG: SDR family NAD(P)-dependent oxidoreductase [bacterium]|nr:SDR family NAD(P)-dependent oxidoreductase [bacterium]
MRLKNKVAIITGAGSGIGRASALAFVREGAKVVVADWSEKGGEETVKLIKEEKGQAIFVKTDVSRAADVENLVKKCLAEYEKVDILFNNAGIVKMGALHETSEADWDQVINVNLKSIFLCSKAVLPEMLKQGKGKIVSTASIAGLVGFSQIGPYCASKGGMIALTREMALEYASKKINVNCIAPGVIKTAMTVDTPGGMKGYMDNTPYPRLGEGEDIAMAALYLASDESDFVTGEVLVVDGGWTVK